MLLISRWAGKLCLSSSQMWLSSALGGVIESLVVMPSALSLSEYCTVLLADVGVHHSLLRVPATVDAFRVAKWREMAILARR